MFLRRVFSFTGERCSVEFGGKASVNFLSENSAPLIPGVSATVSIHLVTPTAVLKVTSFHGRACAEFWHQINTSSHGDLRPKNWHTFSLFDEKGTTSGIRVLANHLASFSFLHLPLSCYSLGLLYWPLYPLLCPTRSQSVGSSWLSFWPGFVAPFNRQTEELTYIPIPLLTVNLWGLLIQTRRGRGNWSYLSPLSGRPRVNI